MFILYLIHFVLGICCLNIYSTGDETLAAHISCLGLIYFHSHLSEILEIYF